MPQFPKLPEINPDFSDPAGLMGGIWLFSPSTRARSWMRSRCSARQMMRGRLSLRVPTGRQWPPRPEGNAVTGHDGGSDAIGEPGLMLGAQRRSNLRQGGTVPTDLETASSPLVTMTGEPDGLGRKRLLPRCGRRTDACGGVARGMRRRTDPAARPAAGDERAGEERSPVLYRTGVLFGNRGPRTMSSSWRRCCNARAGPASCP